MSLYVHRPSVTDDTVAPEGDDTFYALSPVPHLGFDNPVDWQAEAESYRLKVQTVLEDQLLPGSRAASVGRARLHARDVPRPLPVARTARASPSSRASCNRPSSAPTTCREEVPGSGWWGRAPIRAPGLPGVIASAEVLGKLVPDADAPSALPHEAGRRMIAPADMEHCRAAIRTGSLSFHAASRLLPPRVRDPALALYAFCRLADDEVDEHDEKGRAVLSLRDRLDMAYRGRPAQRARGPRLCRAGGGVRDAARPARGAAGRAGLGCDGRQYRTFSGVLDYSARVAAAVGAMMCVLMKVRDADALARACDLGLAMQLTNIARDVGEDARAGRLYLPLDWFDAAGLEPAAFLRDPQPDPRVSRMVRQLLAEAESLYFRSEAGVAALPADCRPGIFAARRIYAGIGAAVARNRHDSITRRARTGRGQKIGWLMLSVGQTGASLALPRPARLHAAPAPEVAFLVEAAARAPASPGRAEALLSVLAQLEAQDQRRRGRAAGALSRG